MGIAFILIGILGIIIFFISLIVSAIRKKNARKKLVGVLVSLVVMIVGLVITVDQAAKDEPAQITPKMYKEIKKGMSYDEVQDIVVGKADTKSDLGGGSISYTYKGTEGVDEDPLVLLGFEDEKLTEKSEIGLLSHFRSSDEESEKETADDSANNSNKKEDITEASTNERTSSSKVVSALESNNFLSFVNEYKELGSDKTSVWDNNLYGKTVTWSGTVVDVGNSQLFLYGADDYNGEDWTQLSDDKKLFYAFTAKFENPDQFHNVKLGDKITLQGSLESRGDYDLGFNWKLYNTSLK